MATENQTQIIIRTGPLTSYRSLNYNLAPKLKELRDAYARGESPDVCWDLRDIGTRTTSMATLTAFLSNAKRLRDFIGKPVPVIMNWDPNVLSFWADVEFLDIADKFQIFQWQEGMIGGFQRGRLNPKTKILYFGDVPKVELNTLDEVDDYKAYLKQKISPNFLLRTASLLDGLDTRSKIVVTNTTLELIANSLIHGLSTCFVGLQRSSSRITIAVCDTGVGFKKSLKKFFFSKDVQLNHTQAIALGSLIQKEKHGLRLAINEVLGYDGSLNSDVNQGWVVVSSYDTEIRWQKPNWDKAQRTFDSIENISDNVPNEIYILGPQNPSPDYGKGYWIKFPNPLIGTRITFEIYISKR